MYYSARAPGHDGRMRVAGRAAHALPASSQNPCIPHARHPHRMADTDRHGLTEHASHGRNAVLTVAHPSADETTHDRIRRPPRNAHAQYPAWHHLQRPLAHSQHLAERNAASRQHATQTRLPP